MKFELRDIVLFLLLLFIIKTETCNNTSTTVPAKADTVRATNIIVIKDSTNHSGSSLHTIERIPYVLNNEPQYIPNPNYDSLSKQFTELRDILLETKIKRDSAKLDTFGTVYITDTVKNNDIQGRNIKYNLKIPKETLTITKPASLKNQWLLGASLQGNKTQVINQLDFKVLMINKKNKGYEAKVGIDNNGRVNYGGGMYIKL